LTHVEDNSDRDIAQLMSKIVERDDAYSDIEAPIEWQRKIRQDHPLL